MILSQRCAALGFTLPPPPPVDTRQVKPGDESYEIMLISDDVYCLTDVSCVFGLVC